MPSVEKMCPGRRRKQGFYLKPPGAGEKVAGRGASRAQSSPTGRGGERAAGRRRRPSGRRPRVGPPEAKDLNSEGWRGRRARAWRYFPRKAGAAEEFAGRPHPRPPTPRGKKKLKGGGERSHPVSSPGFCGRVGAARPRRGRGTSGPMAVNRSRPRLGRGPGLPPPRALPAPAAPQRPAPRPAGLAGRSLRSPGPRGGGAGRGGAGVPRRRILPRGSAQGEGLAAQGEGPRAGLGGAGRAPAPQERGPRGASWVKSGRAAPGEPRGAEVRGQGPGVRRAGPPPPPPPRERSEREEPFCFPPRQRAPLLTGLLETSWVATLLSLPHPLRRQQAAQLSPSPQLIPAPRMGLARTQ
jgi:hypothetical protein